MTTRTVRYIAERALRSIGASTRLKKATDADFNLCFDMFIDMLDYWEDGKGLLLFGNRPTDLNSSVGSEDPIVALYTNLTVYIAPQFYWDLTPAQSAQANDSLRVLRNRLNCLPKMQRPSRMPRGSNNYWYNYYFLNPDGSRCDEEGCTKYLVTNNGGAITT